MNKENDDTYKKYKKYRKKYHELVIKRLKKSVYPTQGNDFYFITIPQGHPDAGKEIPVDYQLKNIVLYFWDKGLITLGWDQGWEGYKKRFQPSFISFTNKDKNNMDTMLILKTQLIKIFGKENIKIWDRRNDIWTTEEEAIQGVTKGNVETFDYLTMNPKKIIIEMAPNAVAIVFRNGYLPIIHKKLSIPMPSSEDRCPGGLIIYTPNPT